MKFLERFNRGVSRFLYKHPNFGIPRLMLYLIIGNALVFVFSLMDRTGMLAWYLCLVPERLLKGELWRLVTFVFVPRTSGLWLVIELYFYYMIGSTLERAWGAGKFTIYYFCGMAITVIYGILAGLITGRTQIITGHFLNLSMFFVYATLWPDNQFLLFFFIPLKVKWIALFEGAYYLVMIVLGRTLLPLTGFLTCFLFCGSSLISSAKLLMMRNRGQARKFRKNMKRAENGQNARTYTRKCAVCGKTDTDYPELEFRYCSQCVGYHCFCADHIHSHIHFTEP